MHLRSQVVLFCPICHCAHPVICLRALSKPEMLFFFAQQSLMDAPLSKTDWFKENFLMALAPPPPRPTPYSFGRKIRLRINWHLRIWFYLWIVDKFSPFPHHCSSSALFDFSRSSTTTWTTWNIYTIRLTVCIAAIFIPNFDPILLHLGTMEKCSRTIGSYVQSFTFALLSQNSFVFQKTRTSFWIVSYQSGFTFQQTKLVTTFLGVFQRLWEWFKND